MEYQYRACKSSIWVCYHQKIQWFKTSQRPVGWWTAIRLMLKSVRRLHNYTWDARSVKTHELDFTDKINSFAHDMYSGANLYCHQCSSAKGWTSTNKFPNFDKTYVIGQKSFILTWSYMMNKTLLDVCRHLTIHYTWWFYQSSTTVRLGWLHNIHRENYLSSRRIMRYL